ncbi:EamA/RhaT family transporter [Chitinophaga costaii]|nr:DMT family transporter [Chitinophaga costaii]PUZ20124.1 EamA/RhaT family transporter [Chitinophaga costaii]
MNPQLIEILEGLLFAVLWASATPATKFAVHSVDPFLLTCIRFLFVGVIMLGYSIFSRKNPLERPSRKQFAQLFILGLLNITVYMSGFLIAIKTVSAGLISLVTATNPLILILLSALLLKRKLTRAEWIGIIIALSGLVVATIPNLRHSHATLIGVIALIAGIVSLSLGAIYFSKTGLALSRTTVNMWQLLFGGLQFIPIVGLNGAHNFLRADLNFFLSFLWLAFPVSIVAYLLWLKLLHKDAVKAGIWLFLTPVLGYAMAVTILHEPLTAYGIVGALLVVAGLFYSRRKPHLPAY